jgi:hypothetical protein
MALREGKQRFMKSEILKFDRFIFLGFAAFLLMAGQGLSRETTFSPQIKEPLVIQRISGSVTLDGLSGEDAWKNIRPLPVVMFMPNYGNPPSEKTEILIGFDDTYLYVAGRLYDREPAKIQAPSKKRDYFESNTEWFGVLFDTFNDKENALGFWTTPSGLRWDGTVSSDAEQRTINDMPINPSWNTFWDVAVVNNDQGWFVEMRIPFSSLRFQDREGRVIMGLTAFRWLPRKAEGDVFPAIDPKLGTMAMWKPSQAAEIVLEGVRSRRPLYIMPYGLGGYGQSHDLNDEETAYVRTNKPTYEAGLDVKYGVTSNLTLDLTLNTDFAQVEADDYQVNLTRFSLFFPEKRLFFLERAGIFDFSFGEYNQLFYSRRIGIAEEQSVRIYGGARLVGRLGPWDLGFLNMQTAPLPEEDLPSQNFGVFRARRRVFNPYSYVGGMLTTRLGTDGSYNTVYGLDGTFRFQGDDYLLLNWAQSFETGKDNNPGSLDPARLRIGWERRTRKGLGFNLGFSRSGTDYDPGMGFEMREDFSRFGNRILYGWLPGEKSFLSQHYLFTDGFVYFRNEDHSLESAEVGPGWGFLTKIGWTGELAFKMYRESVREEISFFDKVFVPPGDYSFCGFKGYAQTPFGKLLSAVITIDAGSFYDGWRATVGIRPIWGISSDLTLSGYYEFNRVDFSGRRQSLTAQIAQVRLLATLSTKFSASAFIQYDSAVDQVTANVRLRFNPREGNDLYLVFNEGLNTDRGREIPYRPYYSGRAVMIKYSYTFVF